MRGRGTPYRGTYDKRLLRHKSVIQLNNCNFYYIYGLGVTTCIKFRKKQCKPRLFNLGICGVRGRGTVNVDFGFWVCRDSNSCPLVHDSRPANHYTIVIDS